jgi:uncharacterized protein YfdQ (DUF2303 family)
MIDHTHIDGAALDKIVDMAVSKDCVQHVDGLTLLVVPKDYQHIDITKAVEKAQLVADRKSGTVILTDIDSFILYVKEQAAENEGYIYADVEAMSLTAVFNDYRSTDAGWQDYRAVYKAELSREFANWKRLDRKPMEQEDFAIFLEDNIADVINPSGDQLLRVALTLQAKTTVDFSSARRLDNGEVQLAYTEHIDARAANGSIEIPREFAIGMRLFKNSEGYKINARLKYRLGAGKVKFWYELDRPDNAVEDAFKQYVTKAAESGYVVLMGKA